MTQLRKVMAMMVAGLVLTTCLDSAIADASIHAQVKRSTVWIVTPRGSLGSGVMVDGDRRLVVTNAHVVGPNSEVAVFAPVHDTNGKVWESSSYLWEVDRLERLGYCTGGRVIAYSWNKDLAILQLAKDLNGLQPIELSVDLPESGEDLHFVGSPGGRPLFSYGFAGTRYVGFHEWTYDNSDHRVAASIIQATGAGWAGNSGGPVVNDRGELVGVFCGSSDSTIVAIAANEVKQLLSTVRWRRVLSINNHTQNVVYFSFRTSPDDDWKQVTIQPCRYHIWWDLPSDAADIQFDHSYAPGYQAKSYKLESNYSLLGDGVHPKPQSGKRYAFEMVGNGIELYYQP